MRLALVRHGRTALNAGNRFQGQSNAPLDPSGVSQARGIARSLTPHRWSAVYSSTMLRAEATADIIARRLGLPHTCLPELRERDLGVLDGTDREEFARRHPDAVRRLLADPGFAPPGGESGEVALARLCRGLDRVVRAPGHPPDQTVLVVTHGGVLGLLARALPGPHDAGVVGNGRAACVDVEPTGDGDLSAALLLWDVEPSDCEHPPGTPPVPPSPLLIPKGNALT
ncbi:MULTISPECIES: histidine phosphatase family protein [unclassified Nocardiopsis]|uniref:histidine phosphatase family protein n=1 Tax=unclassified Nocardiopsis TaxID=2649073 RepID=UPI00135C7312|nr:MULTISPECIES: histidine phosphatase family protein [unclassified Nocardiopsis]